MGRKRRRTVSRHPTELEMASGDPDLATHRVIGVSQLVHRIAMGRRPAALTSTPHRSSRARAGGRPSGVPSGKTARHGFTAHDAAEINRRLGPRTISLDDLQHLTDRDLSGFDVPPEPIWAFWIDAAQVTFVTTAIAARALDEPGFDVEPLRGVDVTPLQQLHPSLRAWLDDHGDGARQQRRAGVYLAEYGLRLPGRRARGHSRFLEAFHGLLAEAARLLRPPDRMTLDATPLLMALRRVNLALAAAASAVVGSPRPQIFDLLRSHLSTGRADLLLAQSLLAHPVLQPCFRGPAFVPFSELWMPAADNVRDAYAILDSLSIYYAELAHCSEVLLLSIRYGPWTTTQNPAAAQAWARYWRSEIWRYIASYREATGADLESNDSKTTEQPSALILRRRRT